MWIGSVHPTLSKLPLKRWQLTKEKVPNQNYFPALTGVRAIAASCVFFHHFNATASRTPWILKYFINELHIGVSIFFVLSGFLICYRYRDDDLTNGQSFRRYLKNRIARIYPMYFILTIISLIYLHITNPFTILGNILLFKGFFGGFDISCIPQGWTITVEETFYFLAPLIFFINRKWKLFWLQAIALIALGWLLVALLGNGRLPYGFMRDYKFMLSYTFFGRCIDFFAGMALALFIKSKKNTRVINHKPYFTILGLLAITGIILIMVYMARVQQTSVAMLSYPGIAVHNLGMPCAAVLFFYGLLNEHSLLRQLLSSSAFQLLGKSSYVFYLIHIGFFQILTVKYTGLAMLGKMELFIVMWLLSIVLFKWVEEPFNKAIKYSNFLVKGKQISQ